MKNIKVNKTSQGPVLAKGGVDCTGETAGYRGCSVPIGDNSKIGVGGSTQSGTPAAGGGCECGF